MAEYLKVPNLGDDFSTAKVLEWFVKEGDVVEQDADVVEIITDKATFVIPAPFRLRVLKILKKEGDLVGEDLVLAEVEAVEG